MYRYGFCYVPVRGYWCGGWEDNAEFDKNIEAAMMCNLQSEVLACAIKSFGGKLEKLSFNKPMQSLF